MSRSLGEFEQLLLFAVLRLGKNAYGARIRREIQDQTGRTISAGAVYTGLDRLQNRGLVSSSLGTATPSRGGRRKKYYTLEPLGAESLNHSVENLSRMADGVLDRLRRMAGDRSLTREPATGPAEGNGLPAEGNSSTGTEVEG